MTSINIIDDLIAIHQIPDSPTQHESTNWVVYYIINGLSDVVLNLRKWVMKNGIRYSISDQTGKWELYVWEEWAKQKFNDAHIIDFATSDQRLAKGLFEQPNLQWYSFNDIEQPITELTPEAAASVAEDLVNQPSWVSNTTWIPATQVTSNITANA